MSAFGGSGFSDLVVLNEQLANATPLLRAQSYSSTIVDDLSVRCEPGKVALHFFFRCARAGEFVCAPAAPREGTDIVGHQPSQ
jgi:hypothetical protein